MYTWECMRISFSNSRGGKRPLFSPTPVQTTMNRNPRSCVGFLFVFMSMKHTRSTCTVHFKSNFRCTSNEIFKSNVFSLASGKILTARSAQKVHISGTVLAMSVLVTLNPPSTTAMERQPRTLFAVLITLVILAMAYFYCEQIEFKFMLKTRRQLNSLPAIKKKSNLFVAADVAARTGNKTKDAIIEINREWWRVRWSELVWKYIGRQTHQYPCRPLQRTPFLNFIEL